MGKYYINAMVGGMRETIDEYSEDEAAEYRRGRKVARAGLEAGVISEAQYRAGHGPATYGAYLVREYSMGGQYGRVWVSQRACRAWAERG